jgi:hypothetical protein
MFVGRGIATDGKEDALPTIKIFESSLIFSWYLVDSSVGETSRTLANFKKPHHPAAHKDEVYSLV